MMWRHDIIMFEANFTLPPPNPSCWGYNELECIALRIVIPFGDPLKIELHLSLSQEAERASLYHTSNKNRGAAVLMKLYFNACPGEFRCMYIHILLKSTHPN